MKVIILKGFTKHEGFEIVGVFKNMETAREFVKEQIEQAIDEADHGGDCDMHHESFDDLGYDWLEFDTQDVM